MQQDDPIWHPSVERVKNANVTRFRLYVNQHYNMNIDNFTALHQWSITDRESFWNAIWDYCEVIGDKGSVVLATGDKMRGDRFFPKARLNFAENLLRKCDGDLAIIFRGEDKVNSQMTWCQLNHQVSRLQQAMIASGVGVGDRISCLMPNIPETVVIMLAATSLGAVFSSCSPDFGVEGVLSRFEQISPKLFFSCDGYWYNGKSICVKEKVTEIAKRLSARLIIVPYENSTNKDCVANATDFYDFISPYQPQAINYTRTEFNAPLFILYSSGTTGKPKCIVHGVGGTLLQLMKEHQLHSDIKKQDRVFFFTTCGWMMWNWLAACLASEATICLYDGSPLYPTPAFLLDYVDDCAINFFGISAKYLEMLEKSNVAPLKSHNLSSLRAIFSTGSTLSVPSFDYVYRSVKQDVHLASMSGGTDIVSCFVLGDPTAPVWRGEIQTAGLGMSVDVWDNQGRSVAAGMQGELVCTKSFTAMPVRFWNDTGGVKYHSAYFSTFPNIWRHGDFIERTIHGGFIISGRSDSTLNSNGVRIGTAEIYERVQAIPQIIESVVVDQEWQGSSRIVLFIRLQPGLVLNDTLVKEIKEKIRIGASPRHVPAKILVVSDIPRTRSGKISELAVRAEVHNKVLGNSDVLTNPESLELFRNRPELQEN